MPQPTVKDFLASTGDLEPPKTFKATVSKSVQLPPEMMQGVPAPVSKEAIDNIGNQVMPTVKDFLGSFASEGISQSTFQALDTPAAQNPIQQAGQFAGDVLGGIANAGTGALVGGALGTLIEPGGGTAIGAGIGTALGNFLGGASNQADQYRNLNKPVSVPAALTAGAANAILPKVGGKLINEAAPLAQRALTQSVIGGAGNALTDAAIQTAESRGDLSKIDPMRVGASAALGAGMGLGTEALAPFAVRPAESLGKSTLKLAQGKQIGAINPESHPDFNIPLKGLYDQLMNQIDEAKTADDIASVLQVLSVNPKLSQFKDIPIRIDAKMRQIEGGQKSRFANTTVHDSELTSDPLQHLIEQYAPTYEPITNQKTLADAQAAIQQDPNGALSHVLNEKNPSALTNTMGQILMRKYQDEGNYEMAMQVLERLTVNASNQGQAIQALSMWGRLTPEGALRYAAKRAKQAGKKLTKPEMDDIYNTAKDLEDMPEGEARTRKEADLVEKLKKVVPPSLGKKLATLQTMAQLLWPKTAIRNVLGNAIFAGAETVSDTIAASIDGVLGVFTGKRTKVMPQVGAYAKGASKGLKAGWQDAIQGIDTSGMNVKDKFDLPSSHMFENPVLRSLETALNIELKTPDRAAYTAAFEESLANRMKAAKANEPTQEMIAGAHLDGLYKTFQDDSAASNLFTGIKKALNLNKDFGAGDFILKYPKTPGNIVSRGFAYSPAGLMKALWIAADPLVGKPFNQRAFSEAMGRAINGSIGAGAFGYFLAKAGVVTGKPEGNKNIESVRRLKGSGQYRVNASALMRFALSGMNPESTKPQKGDVMVSYDWAQPMAIPFSAGVNMAITSQSKKVKGLDKAGAALRQAAEGGDTLIDQPLLQGFQTLFNARGEDGKWDPVGGALDIIANAPASFVPRPFSGVNELIDNTVKETYDPNPLKEMGNKVIAKIPGASQMLPNRKNVWGKDYERYQDGSNNLINVMINPAFVTTLKDEPAGQEVVGIFRRTGEQSQAPRVAGKKVKITRDGNPENIELTGDEISKYQEYIGKKTHGIYNYLMKQRVFKSLPDETKAKIMASVVSSANQAAKYELFGDRPPSKMDVMTLGIISNRSDIVAASLNLKQAQGYVGAVTGPVKRNINTKYNDALIQRLKRK